MCPLIVFTILRKDRYQRICSYTIESDIIKGSEIRCFKVFQNSMFTSSHTAIISCRHEQISASLIAGDIRICI